MMCKNCGYNNNPPDAASCARCKQPLQKNVESTIIFPTGNLAQPDSAVSDVPKTIVKKIDQEPTVSISAVQSSLANPNECSTGYSRPLQPDRTVVMSSNQQSSTIVMKQDPVSSAICEQRPLEVPQKTIIKKLEQIDVAKTTIRQTVRECPHCGYSPVLGSERDCPRCKKPMNNNGDDTSAVKVETKPAATPNSGNSREKTSVEPLIKQQETLFRPFYLNNSVDTQKNKPAEFKLTLLPEDGEQAVAITKQYNGDKVLLNRDNTEPNNMSITSKEQAEVVCEDGHWFLENKSMTGTTYLVVGRKMGLQSGDIIILGNRRFKFDV